MDEATFETFFKGPVKELVPNLLKNCYETTYLGQVSFLRDLLTQEQLIGIYELMFDHQSLCDSIKFAGLPLEEKEYYEFLDQMDLIWYSLTQESIDLLDC